jgi:hypothetical protein
MTVLLRQMRAAVTPASIRPYPLPTSIAAIIGATRSPDQRADLPLKCSVLRVLVAGLPGS